MHPPLILLMRRVIEDIDYKGTLIAAGKTVAISTYGSHRNTEYFPDPERFDPHRPKPTPCLPTFLSAAGRTSARAMRLP